jgi:hypothetical protein
MFFVTFKQDITNVYAFDDDGVLYKDNNGNPVEVLDKGGVQLRGIYLEASTGYLYVADGSKSSSQVYCYGGSGTAYARVSTFISSDDENAILHPFALAFDGKGNCWVSNQNTNVVALLAVEADGQSAYSSSVATYLQELQLGTFLDGTVVASSKADLPNAPQTEDVPAVPFENGGLKVKIKDGKVSHSVRDVAYYSQADLDLAPLLFVVDEPAGLVRLYQAYTGTPLMNSNQLDSPVHLLIKGNTIYVGDGNQVLSSPVPNIYVPNPVWTFNPVALDPALPDDSVSGMAFDNSGNFYVAIRTGSQVWKYDSTFANGAPWQTSPMPDEPEFLLYIPG